MDLQLKLITFNVNGLRSIKDYYAQSKLNNNPSFPEFLDSFEADILCFQEHKTNVPGKLSHDLSFPKGYAAFYAFPRIPKKIGYSGVVTFVKEESPWMPVAWYDGFSGSNDKEKIALHQSPLLQSNFTMSELSELDSEGRCIVTDHFHFILLNIYFPNDSGQERTEFREKFYKAVHLRCLDLIKEHGKTLIILGDINITYNPLDHCEYANSFKSNNRIAEYLNGESENDVLNEFYSNPMRRWLANLVYSDDPESWKDCFRSLHPFDNSEEREKYTCWNTQMSARGTNYGTRIDTIFVSGPLFNDPSIVLEACDILPKVMGSDHCPVTAQFSFPSSFREINETVLSDCKLTKGNVPRQFGKLDSFFAVSTKRAIVEEEVSNDSVDIEAVRMKHVASKSKISDYFKVTKSEVINPKETITKDILEAEHTRETVYTQSDDFNDNTSSQSQSQTSLSHLFNNPQPVPLCPLHREPCQLLKVKKAGANRGRSFYSCARPGGAVGDPAARCDYFEWVNKRK